MTNTFEATLARLKNQQSNFNSLDERAVEIGVVIPMLRQVGWDTDDISEIYPQRGLEDGSKVDYDLQIDGESRILIEVKRWRHDLNDHEEQLARYCRLARPKLAVLTNGRSWRLYLPPNQRKNAPLKKFCEIDITSEQPAKVESVFRGYLGRNSMVGFRPTVTAARKLYQESQAYQKFNKALTEAWSDLANDTDTLAELVTRFAEKRGISASQENIVRFLESHDKLLVGDVTKTERKNTKPASFVLAALPTGKKMMTHQIAKKRNSWKNCLVEVCEVMQKRHPESFHKNILSMTNWFAESEDLKFSIAVGDLGIYARWGNAGEFKAACYELVTKFDYPRDSLEIKDSKGTVL